MKQEGEKGETIYKQRFISKGELPNKSDMFIVVSDLGQVSHSYFSLEYGKFEKQDCIYWLEPTTHHRGSGGYAVPTEEEIEEAYNKIPENTVNFFTSKGQWKNGARWAIDKILSLSNQESKKGFSGNEEVFYEFLEFMRKEMHVDIQWNDKYVIGTWQDKIQSLTPKE